jgi:hypothetical protein
MVRVAMLALMLVSVLVGEIWGVPDLWKLLKGFIFSFQSKDVLLEFGMEGRDAQIMKRLVMLRQVLHLLTKLILRVLAGALQVLSMRWLHCCMLVVQVVHGRVALLELVQVVCVVNSGGTAVSARRNGLLG